MITFTSNGVTIFLCKDRYLEMTNDEFADLERLIKNPPPTIKVNPLKMWSPEPGEEGKTKIEYLNDSPLKIELRKEKRNKMREEMLQTMERVTLMTPAELERINIWIKKMEEGK